MGMEDLKATLEERLKQNQPTKDERAAYVKAVHETVVGMKGTTGLEPDKEKKVLETIEEMMVNMTPPWKTLGIKPDELKVVYNEGHRLFYSGKHEDALQIFDLLSFQDPKNPIYVYCRAACNHKLKNYLDAASQYSLASSLDLTNPLFPFYAADCFIQLKEPASAFRMLVLASNIAEGNEIWTELKTKADILKEAVLQDIKPAGEKST